MERHVRRSYAFGAIFLTTLLTGCSIALIALMLQWHSFVREDGAGIRFPVEGLNNLKVKRAASLLWSCILVLPLCFTGFFLICFLKRFMVILMILMGLLAFASNVYASVNFREIYDKISIIFDDEDSFDERCNSITYSNVKYCACNIGPLDPPANVTAKMLKFRVDECDDLEDVNGKFYIFFKLSLVTSLLSAIILLVSILELCIPLKVMSAVLLQKETTQEYESTRHQGENAGRKSNGVRFKNPVFIQCSSTGQRQSVFWYPYSSDKNPSERSDLFQHTQKQKGDQRNVTFSNFRSVKDEQRIMTACLTQ